MGLSGLSHGLWLSALYIGWYALALLSSVASCDKSGDALQAPLLSSNCNDQPSYQTHLISEDPLVIYIDGFLSQEEALHLVGLSENNFAPSKLFSDDGRIVAVDATYRSSSTATLGQDPLIQCIESRARGFPAYTSTTGSIKPLVVQRYGTSNQYKDHYDWYPDGPYIDGNIESTFFVYIQANCTGGGTNFPRLSLKDLQGTEEEERLCEWIDCDVPYDDGVTFRPVVGNAIFWKNLGSDGKGHLKTLHAGLPVTSGMKTGLNIWTWETARDLKGMV